MDITGLAATELAQSIRNGEFSSREVVEAFIDRIEEFDPRVNALVIRRFDEARKEADEADAARRRGRSQGALHGVPVSVKDQFHVRGLPTTWGLARLSGRRAERDGAMVAALRHEGAIVLGKTNVPQTLVAWETDNEAFGRTNNPWNLGRTPGGSSGGEAALLAARGSPLGLGGDFGGSLRVPAAWCGIFALKPTARRLPVDPMPVRSAVGAEGFVAQAGPMSRNVADLALGFRIMVEYVCAHPTGQTPPVPYRDPEAVDVSRLRIALVPEMGGWTPSPAIRRALAKAADALRAEGAHVEELRAGPDPHEAFRLFIRFSSGEDSAWMRELLGGERPTPLVKPQMISMPTAGYRGLARLLDVLGQKRTSALLRDCRRESAPGLMRILADRLSYETQWATALDAGRYDAVLCPVLPMPAVRHGDTEHLTTAFGSVFLFNVTGMPAGVAPITRVGADEETDRPNSTDKADQAAVTAEKGSAGLPVAVQVASRHWREDIVLSVLSALERSFRHTADYPNDPFLREPGPAIA